MARWPAAGPHLMHLKRLLLAARKQSGRNGMEWLRMAACWFRQNSQDSGQDSAGNCCRGATTGRISERAKAPTSFRSLSLSLPFSLRAWLGKVAGKARLPLKKRGPQVWVYPEPSTFQAASACRLPLQSRINACDEHNKCAHAKSTGASGFKPEPVSHCLSPKVPPCCVV